MVCKSTQFTVQKPAETSSILESVFFQYKSFKKNLKSVFKKTLNDKKR